MDASIKLMAIVYLLTSFCVAIFMNVYGCLLLPVQYTSEISGIFPHISEMRIFCENSLTTGFTAIQFIDPTQQRMPMKIQLKSFH